MLAYLQLIEAAIMMSERNSELDRRGARATGYAPLQALSFNRR